MAITLEPNTRVTNSAYNNISLEDFLDIVDRVEPETTPMYSMAAREMALGNTEFAWTVDSWPTVNAAVGVSDGAAAASASDRNVLANQRKMGNFGQGFRRQYGAGWIAQRVPKVAGRSNLIADAQADAMVLLKQDQEVAFCSRDQLAVQDDGSDGSLMSGYLRLTSKLLPTGAAVTSYTAGASSYAVGQPTDIHYAPTAACVTGASLATGFNLSAVRSISKALRAAAASNGDYVFLCGLDLREAVTALTDPSLTTTTGASGVAIGTTQARMFTQAIADKELGISIDVLRTDWGRWMVVPTRFIGHTTETSGGTVTATRSVRSFNEKPKAGYLLKKGNFAKRIGVAPYVENLAKDGGGDRFDAKTFSSLVVYNPTYAGWVNYTGA